MEIKSAFHFNGYNEKKEVDTETKAIRGDHDICGNPYYVILYNGKSFLVCSVDPYTMLAFYRIDLMSDITDKTKVSVLDGETMVSERKPKRDGERCFLSNGMIQLAYEFQAEHMYMFFGQPCTDTIKIG